MSGTECADAFHDFVRAWQAAVDARENCRGSRDPETAFQEFEEARKLAVKARRKALLLLDPELRERVQAQARGYRQRKNLGVSLMPPKKQDVEVHHPHSVEFPRHR